MEYAVVEKKDQYAIHGIFDSKERADRHVREVIPIYVARSYFMDKTLTTSDFEVIEYHPRKKKSA